MEIKIRYSLSHEAASHVEREREREREREIPIERQYVIHLLHN